MTMTYNSMLIINVYHKCYIHVVKYKLLQLKHNKPFLEYR